MAIISANGAEIAYEEYGIGPAIVYTSAGFLPRVPWAYMFAGGFAAKHRVVLWDKPNTGESGFTLSDAPSEFHMWCTHLHEVGDRLGILPAYFVGPSAGDVVSLLMAHLYPEDVRGLVLMNPALTTAGFGARVVEARYFALADAAEKGGMEAAIDLSERPPEILVGGAMGAGWLAEIIRNNQSNRSLVSEIDQSVFANTMRRWGEWAGSARFHLANLTGSELSRVQARSLVVPGADESHLERLARELVASLPHASLVEASEFWTPEELESIYAQGHNAYMVPYLSAFRMFFLDS